ncbi:hypothetical protein KR093_005379 [Drosophila rubida]|uniref:Alpha-2-macroglobulin domain-containing protein n=1 Tax=Drosophila rubida TaxID=30044 RepID=A0AAD4K5D8_9MUSC|nr:hypothetical protein KR093_005379 [Drosophila rubida]
MAELLTFPHYDNLTGSPNATDLGLFTLTNAGSLAAFKMKNINASVEIVPQAVLKLREYTPPVKHKKRFRLKLRSAHSRSSEPKATTEANIKPRSNVGAYCCTLKQMERYEFDDVMIFSGLEDALAGWRNYTTHVPAVMTSWRLNAFLVTPTTGLALLVPNSINIVARKDLRLEFSLPHHIKVGEVLVLPVKCFNQLKSDERVTIRIKQNATHFQVEREQSTDYHEVMLQVPSNGSNTLTVHIRALKSGTVKLEVSAIVRNINDTVVQQMELQQPGQLLTDYLHVYKVMGWQTLSTDFELKLPYQPTLDGVTCYLSGNLIAANINELQLIDGLDNGEQVISKLMTIYYLWEFVREKTWISSQWMQFLKEQLNDGYQAMQRMRTRNGAYTFHEQPHDNCTSVWLTGLALKMMQRVESTALTFDLRSMVQTEKFLLNNRVDGTAFEEKCDSPEHRKLSNLELSLDVLKSLQVSNRMIRIQESHAWVSEQLASEPNYNLEAKRGFNLQVWQRPNQTKAGDWEEARRNIEVGARILIVHLYRKKETNSQLYKWLIEQLYGENCRVVCYECTVARKAIYTYAAWQTGEGEQNLNITINGGIDQMETIRIDGANKYQTQVVNMPVKSQTLNFKVYGLGELLVQCYYQYNANELTTGVTKSYTIEVTQLKLAKVSHSYLKICVQRDKKKRKHYIGSNLVARLPSGYVFNGRSVSRLYSLKEVLVSLQVTHIISIYSL